MTFTIWRALSDSFAALLINVLIAMVTVCSLLCTGSFCMYNCHGISCVYDNGHSTFCVYSYSHRFAVCTVMATAFFVCITDHRFSVYISHSIFCGQWPQIFCMTTMATHFLSITTGHSIFELWTRSLSKLSCFLSEFVSYRSRMAMITCPGFCCCWRKTYKSHFCGGEGGGP